jgi:hypothetical protein
VDFSAPPDSPRKPAARYRAAQEAGLAETAPLVAEEPSVLRKAVNTLAIVPKSGRITTLGRKCYNVLLHKAQDQGLDKESYRVPLDSVIKGLDFDSNDQALIKKHLRAMVSTTVEWQSPTTGEGSTWNVSGLLAHARLSKERGQVWVEWSYAVNLRQELLEPTVFARLRLEIISQLRSHAALALYEICTRYKDIGRTARQQWRWWHPVLSGVPPSEKTAALEYRIFKRDTLKPAVAEVSAITDIEIELVEHKAGRSIDQIQFLIRPKRQAVLALSQPPQPVDMALVVRAQRLGVPDEAAEAMLQTQGDDTFRAGLDALERRLATPFPEPLRDPVRYLRALLPNEADKTARRAQAQQEQQEQAQAKADPHSAANRELQGKRHARWVAEWTRRRHETCAADIEALSAESQRELEANLLTHLQARNAHPSITKRLAASGWQHPMVRHEMLRYFGEASYGAHWDKPSDTQLLAIAVEMGAAEVGEGAEG